MSDQTIILTILGVAIVIFVWNRLPVGVVALGVAIALWATGVVTLEEALSGFSSPTVILIAALFVVAEGLDAAGITTWIGQLVLKHSSGSPVKLIVMIMAAVALMSALITPNGSVAALYPMVVVLALKGKKPPSKLLMPTAFAAHAGALLVLTGSPVTLLVSEAAYEAGHGRIAYFEIALTGIPLLIGTMLVTVLLGDRLLPTRTPEAFARDLSQLPASLRQQYLPECDLMRLRVGAGSPFVGQMAGKVGDPAFPNVRIISLDSVKGDMLIDEPVIEGTTITIRGPVEEMTQFVERNKLGLLGQKSSSPIEAGMISRDYGVAEVIVTPRSDYIGDHVFPGMVTDSGSLVVLAVQRHGEDLGVDETVLRAGDSLLLQGRWRALDQYTKDPNVVVVDTPDAIRRQTAPLGAKAIPAVTVLGAMVILLATGIVPAVIACLLAAIAMVLLKVVTVEQAHHSIALTTVILVAAMIPLSDAITKSGTAETIAHGMMNIVGGGGPYLMLTGIFVVTAVLGQLISNTATALILIPITISIAVEAGYSPMTLLIALNVAAAASLLTPIATPANLMVMGPAGYKFSDYWKFGLAVMVVYYLVSVFLVPVIWPL